MIEQPELLTSSEVAALFGVQPHTVRRWVNDGVLPSMKTLGGHARIRRDAVDALLRTNTTEAE